MRGYATEEHLEKISKDDFERTYLNEDGTFSAQNMTFLATSPVTQEKIMASFMPSKVTVPDIKEFEKMMKNSQAKRGIIVVVDSITAMAKRALQTAEALLVETFVLADLVVNITKHKLVPKHTLLTAEEKAALLERYHLKETQLPRINQHDAVARFLGLRPGNVVRIERNSETAGRYITYRLVV